MTTIHFTQAAITEINRIKSKSANPNMVFRLGVKAGGCASLYYTLELDEVIESSDQVLDCGGIKVVIDAGSQQYLDGLSLDYTEDLMGGGFRFNNPNAASSCGCGNSFSMSPA